MQVFDITGTAAGSIVRWDTGNKEGDDCMTAKRVQARQRWVQRWQQRGCRLGREGEQAGRWREKTSQVCEVWCEGRGLEVWDVSPPSDSSVFVTRPLCIPPCTGRCDTVKVGVGSHYQLRSQMVLGLCVDVPATPELHPRLKSGGASLRPRSPSCQGHCLLVVLESLFICGFVFILTLSRGRHLCFWCRTFLFPWSSGTMLGHHILVCCSQLRGLLASAFSAQLLFFTLILWTGFMSKLWMVFSLAKYSLWSSPKIISAPSSRQHQDLLPPDLTA